MNPLMQMMQLFSQGQQQAPAPTAPPIGLPAPAPQQPMVAAPPPQSAGFLPLPAAAPSAPAAPGGNGGFDINALLAQLFGGGSNFPAPTGARNIPGNPFTYGQNTGERMFRTGKGEKLARAGLLGSGKPLRPRKKAKGKARKKRPNAQERYENRVVYRGPGNAGFGADR